MDLQVIFLAVGVFVFAVASLLFVYKLGIKEKSYEEAVAEQRNKTNALLGSKSKVKEKKTKKAKKLKEKEKIVSTDTEKSEESETAEPVVAEAPPTPKPHVEFKEDATVVIPEDLPVPVTNNKKHKKEKVKPILLNKDEKPETANKEAETPSANQFDKIHPKDEFELLNQQKSKEDVKPTDNPKPLQKLQQQPEKQQKSKQIELKASPKPVKKSKQLQHQPIVEEVLVKEEPAPNVVLESAPKINETQQGSGKEKKKKKGGELNALQQIAAEKQGINLSAVVNLVRKADFSRSEVQILIDLLLNKQQEASNLDDWSEGKSDPIQRLKKQLADKEKALQDEQEALIGAQQRVKDLRKELNEERTQHLQQLRSLEEALQSRQLEVQKLNAALHVNQQQLQQLQSQIADERMSTHKAREENAALMMQRQQQECLLAQAQETENVVTQLRAELQELSGRNNQLTLELHALSEQTMAEKEGQQGYITQLQIQLNTFQKDLEQKNDIINKQEETRMNLERHLDMAQRQENDLKGELARLKNACQMMTEDKRGTEHVIMKMKQQLEYSESLVAKLKDELDDVKANNLKAQEAHLNGEKEQIKNHEVEIYNLHNEIASLKRLLDESKDHYNIELNLAKSTISKLENELVEQKNKNNELRRKNWKVMEALSAAESRIKAPETNNHATLLTKIRNDEHESQKRFIERLFPDIATYKNLPPNEWSTQVEKAVRNLLDSVQSQKVECSSEEIEKLKVEIEQYKSIIDDTEGTLRKLQAHIESAEIKWSEQLKAKDLEIEVLKSQTAGGHVEIR